MSARKLMAGAVAVVVVIAAAGCGASNEQINPPEPQVWRLPIADGRKVVCVSISNSSNTAMSLSCDWGNAK
ncbi:hypothetical protein Srot_0044 [Segniliparus rotundus DSM 44985]|uniref:Uncharacterized protein n=1 Tax=Segniliparus rotundus (strain ATCC BAA-972 / CDC 1076 / CIP 108378 / DSM 44985 / JCM 13578) TaxID=640132 RepID=D6Z9L0_SEGRD|nr:hypothetical protein [Segniliparus rotundus]ADG96537.1 hypothetical protein Srot_0044 [Segniliparus rotundus DSM 44985]